MKIPHGATSFAPAVVPLHAGFFKGRSIRHTVRPSGTRDWLLIYTLRGSGLYRHASGEFQSAPGDITLFRPGAFQDYQCAPEAKQWDLLYAHFVPRAEWISWLNWPEQGSGLLMLGLKEPSLRNRILLRLRDMVRLSQSAHPRREELGLNALEEALLWCDSANPQRLSARLDPRIRKAMDHLSMHISEPFSEAGLARAASLSPSHLRHLFREQTGESPRRFQELQRLRRAMDLLAMSRLSIAEIANDLGFENPFYFTLRFKKHTGESPTAFRKRVVRREEAVASN